MDPHPDADPAADDRPADQPADRPAGQVPAEHPAGHEDEVLLDSPEQAAALLAEEGDGSDDGSDDGAPWTDGPDHVADDLPEPSATPPAQDEEEVLPLPVEGVGDLVADPLARAKVIARDDPGGPAPEEVPPSPS